MAAMLACAQVRRQIQERKAITEWLNLRRESRLGKAIKVSSIQESLMFIRQQPLFPEEDQVIMYEKCVVEYLLRPVLELPLAVSNLHAELVKAHSGSIKDASSINTIVENLLWQNVLDAHWTSEKRLVITGIRLENLSKFAEGLGIVKSNELMLKPAATFQEEIDYLLTIESVRERGSKRMGSDIQHLLNTKSVMEQMKLQNFQSAGGSQLREFCYHKTKEDCRRARSSKKACAKLHFHRIIHPHTDQSLGDCSFLNTCFHVETCKFVHYTIDDSIDEPELLPRRSITLKPTLPRTKLVPPQWINCDMRYFDMSVIGKFAVIMADPPWDIHMELPYGTMGDDEMRQLNIPALQDEGYIFLWVTGRAMELGRECLTLWGYERVDDLIWVKTNQLQRLIRTGRTGHWINHGKEHCLVGVKGNPTVNKGIDADVIVAEVRATSHKPDEIYGVIERLSPGTRKVELFGRMHNCQPNWMTLGNQLDGVKIIDPDVSESFYQKYPRGDQDTMKPPTVTVLS